MTIQKIYSVYFSATYSTKQIVNTIASYVGEVNEEIDITASSPESDINLSHDDLLVIGVPVYGGRVPVNALEGLNAIKGNKTPAIIVAVYGNRDYDDALLELHDIVSSNGFKVIAATTIVAEHSIFPNVAAGRPDDDDWTLIRKFCSRVKSALTDDNVNVHEIPADAISGKRPYKKLGLIPLHPTGGKDCTNCGKCVSACPVQAIPADNPRQTNKEKCIACARCIKVCSQKSRRFRAFYIKWHQ